MKTTNHRIKKALFYVAIVGVVAACGGNPGSGSPETTNAEVKSSETADTTSSDSSTIDWEKVAKGIQICETAVTGTSAITPAQLEGCGQTMTMSYDCDKGAPVTIVGFNDKTYGLRVGQIPIILEDDYTFDDLMAYCNGS